MRGDLIEVFNILTRESGGAGTNIFTPVTSKKTGGNNMKLSQGRFRLDTRKKDFHPEGPQGSCHSTKPDSVQEGFGHSQAQGVTPEAVLCRARSWT